MEPSSALTLSVRIHPVSRSARGRRNHDRELRGDDNPFPGALLAKTQGEVAGVRSGIIESDVRARWRVTRVIGRRPCVAQVLEVCTEQFGALGTCHSDRDEQRKDPECR